MRLDLPLVSPVSDVRPVTTGGDHCLTLGGDTTIAGNTSTGGDRAVTRVTHRCGPSGGQENVVDNAIVAAIQAFAATRCRYSHDQSRSMRRSGKCSV